MNSMWSLENKVVELPLGCSGSQWVTNGSEVGISTQTNNNNNKNNKFWKLSYGLIWDLVIDSRVLTERPRLSFIVWHKGGWKWGVDLNSHFYLLLFIIFGDSIRTQLRSEVRNIWDPEHTIWEEIIVKEIFAMTNQSNNYQ